MDEIEKLKEKEKQLWTGEKTKYIEQLESALDKACELLANGGEVFCKDCFKETKCRIVDINDCFLTTWQKKNGRNGLWIMKKIIGNLLYDTEKSKKIYSFKQKRKISTLGNINFFEWYKVDVYKTKNENYFIHSYIENGLPYKEFLEEFSEPELKEVLKKIDPDRYIEFGFNDVKEA